MPQLAKQDIKARAARLRDKGGVALEHYLRSQSGRHVEVMMEHYGLGRTPQFAEVVLADAEALAPASIVNVRITGQRDLRLRAEVAT